MELRLNLAAREVQFGNAGIHLSGYEYQILWLLHRAPRAIVSESKIVEFVYDDPEKDIPLGNTIKVCICRLRKKLEKLTSGRWRIENHHAQGYSLEPPD